MAFDAKDSNVNFSEVSGLNLLIAMIVGVCSACVSWLASRKDARKDTRDAMREAMDGYQKLAEVRSEEIERLSQRLGAQEEEIRDLRAEQVRQGQDHIKVLNLNIQLQQELREAQKENATLREIVRQNASEKADLLERIERLERLDARK